MHLKVITLSLEKFFLKKIELWLVCIIILFFIIGIIQFGSMVQSPEKFGKAGDFAQKVAEIPSNVELLLKGGINQTKGLKAGNRFKNNTAGFTFNYEAGSRPELSYILINRYDGDLRMSVSELVDLNTQELIHQWRFDVDSLWEEGSFGEEVARYKKDMNTRRFRNKHSYLLKNGSLLTNSGMSPLIINNLCSEPSIFNKNSRYHHSIEIDSNDNFWVPNVSFKGIDSDRSTFFSGKKANKVGLHREDGIVQLSLDGSVIFEQSIIQIFIDNNMEALIFGESYDRDPIHLNDIQPVLKSGPFWKKGDLFLSMRHQSMIMLYRPSENKVIWYKQGPWLGQHDVDIINEHTIGIFNNDYMPRHKIVRKSFSEQVFYDFSTQETSTPFNGAMSKLNVITKSQGRSDLINDNELWVEEGTNGRSMQFDKKGNISWQYINKSVNNTAYILNWSRLISREKGDIIRELIKEENCNEI